MQASGKRWGVWLTATMILAGVMTEAGTRSWINTSGGTWDDATTANWSGNTVPVGGDDVRITNSVASSYTVDYASANFSGANTLAGLILQNPGGGTATLQLGSGDLLQLNGNMVVSNGGRLTLDAGALLTNYNANTAAKLNVGSGGTVTMSGGTISLPNAGFYLNDGSWTQSGGDVVPNGTITMADSPGQTVSLSISGGSISNLQYGLNARAGNTTVTVSDQGVFSIAGNGGNDIRVGTMGGTHSWTVTGGTLANRSGTTALGTNVLGYGSVTWTQSGGYVYHGTLRLNATATLEIRDGAMTNGTLYVDSGTLNLRGGRCHVNNAMRVGDSANGAIGQLIATNGYLRSREFWIATNANSSGTLTLGANVDWRTGSITPPVQLPFIGSTSGTGTGMVELLGNNPVPSSSNQAFCYMTIHKTGVIRGYGGVTHWFSPYFIMNGRIIADGYGTDQTLNVLTQPPVSNTVDNVVGENRGWYAQNHGKLTLRGTNVAAGACTRLWGEDALDADGIPDLVNSVKFDFTGITGGALTNVLLAADRSDVPAGLFKAIGVWEASGVNLGSGNVSLTIRYDDAAAVTQKVPQNLLAIWRYDGTVWRKVPSSVDTVNKRISTTTPLTALGKFAVAPSLKGMLLEVY